MIKKVIKNILNKLPYISRLSKQVQELGSFPAGHYYSPIPSKAQVTKGVAQNSNGHLYLNIELNQADQLLLIEEFATYYKDLPFKNKRDQTAKGFYLDQGWFGYTDAIMLYNMIRKFRFKKIVEVGSGFSSAAMVDSYLALDVVGYNLVCVEPYPDRLQELIDIKNTSQVELIEATVQDCDISLFKSLSAGDMLFIDSSHVVKYKSDLHYLLFNVLPILQKGVMVHFHDIFYPFEYPSEWLLEGRYWNECYFLRAFLTGNSEWKIVLFNNYVNTVFSEEIKTKMPLCRQNQGGSLYLQRV